MNHVPALLTIVEWDTRYRQLSGLPGFSGPAYGGPLGRHVKDGDLRLKKLKFDNSTASLDLWNFLLTENDRLHAARRAGGKIVGAMKDLGTVPVMACSVPGVTAFYPDGAWWTPCIMDMSEGLLELADSMGIDESFCPVRAMLGAFVNCEHFPVPDLLVCSAGAVCDDFSAIAQRLENMGFPFLWWEVPSRRPPWRGSKPVLLPGGFHADRCQVSLVEQELRRVRRAIEELSGQRLTDARLKNGIKAANRVRRALQELRRLAFEAPVSPLPALELQVAEMLAIHFCSDRGEAMRILDGLLREVRARARMGVGFGSVDAARVFWVNPVADIRVMNMLEECGGRLCGTDFLFSHALDLIPTHLPPMQALARMALADPMVGQASERADRICRDAIRFKSEAMIISKIPGASHCALESDVISGMVTSRLGIPVLEIEVPPVSDAMACALRTRLQALVETAGKHRRRRNV